MRLVHHDIRPPRPALFYTLYLVYKVAHSARGVVSAALSAHLLNRCAFVFKCELCASIICARRVSAAEAGRESVRCFSITPPDVTGCIAPPFINNYALNYANQYINSVRRALRCIYT